MQNHLTWTNHTLNRQTQLNKPLPNPTKAVNQANHQTNQPTKHNFVN